MITMQEKSSSSQQTWERARYRMVRDLRREGIRDERVLQAMRQLPRHEFVPPVLAHRAYSPYPVAIGEEQTLSQPYIVAYMTELLIGKHPLPLERVLEIGTGSGYQAAILSLLCRKVYSLERIRSLYLDARLRLRRLGIHNVQLLHRDGAQGWPEKAPFDGIIGTAAPREVPESLLEQLKVGGRLIIPLGEARQRQQLRLILKTPQGIEEEDLLPVRFVPFLPNVRT